jgi:hypothetical protein
MSITFLGEHSQAFHFIGFALVLTGDVRSRRGTREPLEAQARARK